MERKFTVCGHAPAVAAPRRIGFMLILMLAQWSHALQRTFAVSARELRQLVAHALYVANDRQLREAFLPFPQLFADPFDYRSGHARDA
jgi:hypothetical protein